MACEYVVNCRDHAWEERDVDWVYIGRPSKWGNRFTHRGDIRSQYAVEIVATREEAVAKYEEWIRTQPHLMASLDELRGKASGAHQQPSTCHGDVLVKLLRETEP